MRRALLSRLTIRARLTLVYGSLFMFAGIVLLAVTYALVWQRMPGADGTRVAVRGGGVGGGTAGVPAPSRSASPQVLIDGNALRSTSPSPAASAAASPAPEVGAGATPPPKDDPLAGVPNFEDTVRGIEQGARNDALRALLTQGGIALLLVGSAAIAFGWLLAGRLLQPLQGITETARRIAEAPGAAQGLHERINLVGPRDEVKELADTFNVMLERLDRSFDSQRRFISNASHELRTPIALNRALLEVTLYRPAGAGPGTAPDLAPPREVVTSPEVRQLAATLLDINSRHERLLDGLLLLARSDREVTDRPYVDLADIVEHVVGRTPSATVTVSAEADEAPTSGNPALLERLVQNLVDNGIRYNVPSDGWVRVRCGADADGRIELTVANTGPVIPPYEVPSLFEPFRRLGAERVSGSSPGAGLGLSIVQAVARAHGGDVHAQARDGGGLIVTVTLPRSS